MPIQIDLDLDLDGLKPLQDRSMRRATVRALRKAGSTALRDMRSEASKRVRARKRIKAKEVRKTVHLSRPKTRNIDDMEWALKLSGKPVSLTAYPHRQTRKGVRVEVNRGKRTLLESAFVATMASGHKGVFRREGRKRLPIRELLGSRPVDALLHEGEADAVAERGMKSLQRTFRGVMPLELDKER